MNVVMVIPTGIGAEIGGHAGDATPVVKLLGSVCNKLVLHPNVVNASDINEMPPNSLYVEGSILDRFLEGKFELQEVWQNKILVVVNPPISSLTINAVSAARTTLGAEIEMLVLNKPLQMIAQFKKDGSATGEVKGWHELVEQVQSYKFDALAIATPITIDNEIMMRYFKEGGINPIGGVEAKASRLIATALNKPVAHAPFEGLNSELWKFNEVVDPRIAAEMVSACFLHCVLKGLHKAPRIGSGRFVYCRNKEGLAVDDIDFLITPVGCVGKPHKACLKAGIPIIAVRENTTCLNDKMPDEFIIVENYLEAVGVIVARKAGVSLESVRRSIGHTNIHGITGQDND